MSFRFLSPPLRPQRGSERRAKIRLLLWVLLGLVVVDWHYETFWKGGTIHTLWAPDRAAYLSFDGLPIEVRSTLRHQRYDVRSGTNFVRAHRSISSRWERRITEYTLNIRAGSDELLLPIDEDQCFVTFEIAAPSAANHFQLRARHDDHRPLQVADVRYFGAEALPKTMRARVGSLLVEQVACADVNRSEAELLTMLHL